MISLLGKAIKAAKDRWKNIAPPTQKTPAKKAGVRTKVGAITSVGMTGVGVASIVPPSQRALYEAQAKEAIERHS